MKFHRISGSPSFTGMSNCVPILHLPISLPIHQILRSQHKLQFLCRVGVRSRMPLLTPNDKKCMTRRDVVLQTRHVRPKSNEIINERIQH